MATVINFLFIFLPGFLLGVPSLLLKCFNFLPIYGVNFTPFFRFYRTCILPDLEFNLNYLYLEVNLS